MPRARLKTSEPKMSPVIFPAPMVLAILERRQTQTRRILRGGPDLHTRGRLLTDGRGAATFGDRLPDDPVPIVVRCPYGRAGDRFWVRRLP